MKVDRENSFKLINKHFRSSYGNAYIQKEIIKNKERARVIIQEEEFGK